ncbi:MAG: ABC transporter permease [Anaerolineae bacterium]|nr:MAG: ABC transporter permease [Anaerolineae bacterium]
MQNSRLFALIRKEFIQILRDPRTLALVLVIPIMQLLLLGYAATNDVRNVPMAVFDQDRSPASRELLDAYRAADYFSIAYDVTTEADLQRLIEDGKAGLGLIIPPGFGAAIHGSEPAAVLFIIDGSDPSVAATGLSAAQLIGQNFGVKVQTQRLARSGIPLNGALPLQVHTQIWYNPDLHDSYFMVPGIIGMILYAITSILTANAVVRERERGTIEQLIITPIRPWELVVGKIAPYTILALLNTVEVLVMGSLLFGVPIRGSLFLILALSGVFLLTSLGIGLLASTVANTQQEAMLTVWMTMLPALFLSGFFFPLQAMPKPLQIISYLFPLRYYLNIIRTLMLKGTSILAVWPDVLAMTVFGIALMALASVRFRKRLD